MSLSRTAAAQFQRSIDACEAFFEHNADRVSQACFEMARRFHRGGRLLVFGTGASATDAQHVAVEFVHPVIVGKRALPAMALTADVASLTGLAGATGLADVFARQVRLLGRAGDIAFGLATGGDEAVFQGLAAAREVGMLVLYSAGAGGTDDRACQEADFCFRVLSDHDYVVQEVQETLYHVLWETVHVFFEHKGYL